jgi:hypothetical protein
MQATQAEPAVEKWYDKPLEEWTDADHEKAAALRLEEARRLAMMGFSFAPCPIGGTHGIKDWPKLATTDVSQIEKWLREGYQLVMVPKRTLGTGLDVDGLKACLAMGFDLEWIKGCYRTRTPGGGRHIYLPWHPAFASLPPGAKIDIRSAEGGLVAEWKIEDSSVTAPWSFRSVGEDGSQTEGYYIPEVRSILPCPDPKALVEWFLQHRAAKDSHPFSGPPEKWEFHPDFDMGDFLEYHGCTEKCRGTVDGALHVEVEECPCCGKEARHSTLAAAISKLIFGGTGFGYVCFGCGISSREGLERRLAKDDPTFVPWQDFIYRHDDSALLLKDGAKVGFEVRIIENPLEAEGEAEGEAEARGEAQAEAEAQGKAQQEAATPEVAAEGPETKAEKYNSPGTGKSIAAEELKEVGEGTPAFVSHLITEPEAEALASEVTAEKDGEIILSKQVGDEGSVTFVLGMPMAKVVPEAVECLWPDKIPLSTITWFVGKPDNGKTFALLDVIARVSMGLDWPDGAENHLGPRKVLLGASEDSIAATIKPRLMAAGANMDNIIVLKGIAEATKGEKRLDRQLRLQQDIFVLKQALRQNPGIVLLALDPVGGYFGEADPNKDKEIRPLLEMVSRACAQTGVAFVGVIHHNKRNDLDVLQRILGASAVAGVCRSAWNFSRDPQDKDLFRMARVKGNLSKKRKGLRFRLEDAEVELPDGKKTLQGHAVWEGEIDEDADELNESDRLRLKDAGESTQLGRAKLWILYRLEDGKMPAKALEAEARAMGYSYSTLRRAREELTAEKKMRSWKPLSQDKWWWELVAKDEPEEDVSGKLVDVLPNLEATCSES